MVSPDGYLKILKDTILKLILEWKFINIINKRGFSLFVISKHFFFEVIYHVSPLRLLELRNV